MLLVSETSRELSVNLRPDVLLNTTYRIGKLACIFADGKLLGVEQEDEKEV